MLNIYLNTWGNYNENGADFGEWVSLPMDEDELQEKMDAIAEVMEGHGVNAEEWFINDYEWTIDSLRNIDENEDIFELNEWIQKLDDLDQWEQEIYMAAVEVWGAEYIDLDDLDEYRIISDIEDEYDLGYYWVHESGCYDLGKMGTLANYIDYKAFGRDISLETDGGFCSYGWIERC